MLTCPSTERAQRFLSATRLHQILELALEDLEKIEQSQDYLVYMGEWHLPVVDLQEIVDYGAASALGLKEDGCDHRCVVCLAGSVMANTLGVAHDVAALPGGLGPRVAGRLLAINCLRMGDVCEAVCDFYDLDDGALKPEEALALFWKGSYLTRQFTMHDYRKDRPGWWQDIRQLLADLKEKDL